MIRAVVNSLFGPSFFSPSKPLPSGVDLAITYAFPITLISPLFHSHLNLTLTLITTTVTMFQIQHGYAPVTPVDFIFTESGHCGFALGISDPDLMGADQYDSPPFDTMGVDPQSFAPTYSNFGDWKNFSKSLP